MTTFKVSYKLTPTHLAVYRAAILKRLQRTARRSLWWQNEFAGFIGSLIIGAILAASGTAILQRLTGEALDWPSAVAGALLAIISVVLIQKYFMSGFRAVMNRTDSPTLAPHEGIIDENRLEFSAQFAHAVYQWGLFTDVSEVKDLIFVWFDTAQGIVLPRAAFTDEAAAQAFCTFARDQIAAAQPSSNTPTQLPAA